MERPSWKRILTGTAQAWAVLVVFWYAAVFSGIRAADRTELWQQLNPLPLLGLLAGMVVTIRFLPPRNWSMSERVRRSLWGSLPWTLVVGIAAAFAGRLPDPEGFGEGIYRWFFMLFLWFHGWPFVLLPALYVVERPWILAAAGEPDAGA